MMDSLLKVMLGRVKRNLVVYLNYKNTNLSSIILHRQIYKSLSQIITSKDIINITIINHTSSIIAITLTNIISSSISSSHTTIRIRMVNNNSSNINNRNLATIIIINKTNNNNKFCLNNIQSFKNLLNKSMKGTKCKEAEETTASKDQVKDIRIS